ncbi:N-acetyltransferase [Xylanibacillus composti]|nr:N-acetyltransferase [Xylanibacillus composti]
MLYDIPQNLKRWLIKLFNFNRLEGKRIELEPLETRHTESLFNISQANGVWTYLPGSINTIRDMDKFIRSAIEARETKQQFPFAVYDKQLNEYVGSTQYLRISEINNNLNIGWTWYHPKVWRTKVNTEAKYLLLRYAFEELKVCRVEIITTTDNVRSQKAIERLGAVREGVLRKKFIGLDFVIFSILDTEWEFVKNRLEGFLGEAGYVI